MKKRVLSAFVAGITGAMFGVLYPEYILLPDTYQYIEENSCQKQIQAEMFRDVEQDIEQMLNAEPDQIIISSKLFQFLADEGIVLWKNLSMDMVDMP